MNIRQGPSKISAAHGNLSYCAFRGFKRHQVSLKVVGGGSHQKVDSEKSKFDKDCDRG